MYPVDAKISKYQKGKLLGFAKVFFSVVEKGNGVIEMDGFRIFAGDEGLQVAPPSKKADDGTYSPLFRIVDKEDPGANAWMESISNLVKQKFAAESSNTTPTSTPVTNGGGIKKDDIPF